MPGFNHATGVRVLKDAVRAYAREGITAWIQDGTLLGAVRHGHPIPWDDDMDLGVMHEDWNASVDAALKRAGFKSDGNHNAPDSDYHQKWIRSGVRFCVFHYYRAGNGRVWHGLRRRQYRYYYPHEFDLRPILLMGTPFMAPYPPEEFLETKYGDWRTPRKRWSAERMPANAVRIQGGGSS